MRWRPSPQLRTVLLRFIALLIIYAVIEAFTDTYGPSWAGHLAHFTGSFAGPPTVAWAFLPLMDWRRSWRNMAIVGMVLGLLQPPRDIWWFWGSFASLIVYLIIRWWNSTRRKRATQALGNKARAIRAKLARTMRERRIPIPQPV